MTQPIEQERNPEVWEPPELVARLTVGTRVRWRISAECGRRCQKCGQDVHPSGQAGTGTIVRIERDEVRKCSRECCNEFATFGHYYGVSVLGSLSLYSFYAAASELEPLAPEPAEEAP